MNKQRKVLTTITYNEMGIIIDTKTEELGSSAQPTFDARDTQYNLPIGTDLISRQQAIGALRNYLVGKNVPCDGTLTCRLIENEVISKLPSAQPKRCRWIKTARWGRVYYCDQCRNYLDFDGVNAGRGSTNFCPNCGAKMEGADDE